jgi:hypothetical protein
MQSQPQLNSDTITVSNYLVNNALTSSSSNCVVNQPYPTTPPPKRRKHSTTTYSPGELGKLADCQARLLAGLGWARYFRHMQSPHSIHPDIHHIPHPTAQYLASLACSGVPAMFASPWTREQCDAAVKRGPHRSAHQYTEFLHQDLFDYVQMGYWTVLPYRSVRHYQHLRIAPAGVVPQRDRRPRPIMDYTFYNTNQDCLPRAPYEAMQFGGTLQRLLQRIAYCNPKHGPPLLAKIDLADGYYRVPLCPQAALALAVVIPPDVQHSPTPLVAIPLTLPMGWAQSPPYFCAFTETITDMANDTSHSLPHHPLLHQSQNFPCPQQPTFHPSAVTLGTITNSKPLSYIDIYIDDFMILAQPPLHEQTLNTLLHTLHSVFHDSPNTPRRAVISQSKLDKGDAAFSTKKRILGWDVDTCRMTIQLPPHRLDTIQNTIHSFLHKSRTSRTQWQRLLGTLRSSSPALYGATHLFSILQHTLTQAKDPRLRLTALVKAVLRDWLLLATTASQYPVPIHTLVPRQPTCIAAADASRDGMGGFWMTADQNILWRTTFPLPIRDQLITQDNPTGTLTNSDLELTALITGCLLPAAHSPLPHPSIAIASDNTPAVAWAKKGSTTSNKAPAFLLHQLARQRRALPFDLQPFFTPGTTNLVADLCSRSFHLSDTAFLLKMNSLFPIQPCWQLAQLPPETRSQLNSALLRQLQPLASRPPAQTPTTLRGTSGWTSVNNSVRTPVLTKSTTPYPSSNYLPIDTERVPWLPVGLQCVLERWKAPFAPWGRRLPHWAPWTQG